MSKLKKKVYKRLNELLGVLDFNDNELSDDMCNKIELNIRLLSLYNELKTQPYSEVSAIGFYDEDSNLYNDINIEVND